METAPSHTTSPSSPSVRHASHDVNEPMPDIPLNTANAATEFGELLEWPHHRCGLMSLESGTMTSQPLIFHRIPVAGNWEKKLNAKYSNQTA